MSLKEIRKNKGITQKQMALNMAMCKVSQHC